MTREEVIQEATEKYDEAYSRRTPKSRAALFEAAKVLPGGDSRTATFFYPHPIFLAGGNGCYVRDLDGNDYIDFHNCYTALVHGHCYTPVLEAIKEVVNTIASGVGAPTTLITEWATTLCRRVDSLEKIRFCNSGTEAAMMAIRTARAYTRRDKILKIEGGYNGAFDAVVHPPDALGLTKSIQAEQLTVPFNDADAAERIICDNKDDLACMIVEGMMGAAGQIPPKEGYLEHLRNVTRENGVLLVLDEVMCFRIDYGGIQRIHGIKPDLTMFGKIIGGGFPVGAWGGREDIMQLLDPLKGRTLVQTKAGTPAVAQIYHGGTFNANPVVANAGRIMLEKFTPEEVAKINKLGESLAVGIRNVFARLKIKGQVTGIGSLQNLHFTPERVVDYKTAQTSQLQLMHMVHLGLLQRGIFLPARGLFALSTPMTEKEINVVVKAMDDIMTELKPLIEQVWPELME